MALLMRGDELMGHVQIIRRNVVSTPPSTAPQITFEAEFLVLPGSFTLVDDDGARRPITVTLVFPSRRPLRAEAQLEPA